MSIRSISSLVFISLVLSGCFATGGGTQGDDGNRTRVEGTALGALLGAGLGVALGGDAESAAIGAAIGAAGGFALGNEIAKRKKRYKTKEDLIAGESTHLSNVLQETKNTNQALRKDIKQYKKEVKGLKAKLKQNKAQKNSLKHIKTKIDQRHSNTQKSLQAVNNELKTTQALYDDTQKTAGSQDKKSLKTWQGRIKQLKAQKVQLENNTQQLQAVSNTIAL